MSEHLNSNELKLFIAHQLAPAELLRAATHISGCQSCRERIGQAESTGVRIENLRAELRRDVKPVEQHLDHLNYEQLEAYVDDTLDAVGREVADNHLAICPSCAVEAQELESFRQDLAHPTHTSKTMPSFSSKRSPKLEVQSSKFNVQGLFRDRLSPRLAWAAAAALFITIATAGLLLWQRGKAPEVANNNGSNAPEVVKNNSDKTTEVVSNGNDNQPEVVNNVNANATGHGSGNDSTNRRDSVNANRRETVPDSNLHPGVGVAAYAAVIKRALETQRLAPAPALQELAGKPSTLMNGSQSHDLSPGPEGGTFSLLQPVGTLTLSDRPNFNWRPLRGATSYLVFVLDHDLKVVAESVPIYA